MSTAPPNDVLAELARELTAEASVISEHVVTPSERPHLGLLTGVLAPAKPYLPAVIESVREGYLLHYGQPRVIAPPDPDLALLAGDYLYARALSALAAAADLEAIRELADLISLSAQVHESHPHPLEASAKLWLASAVAIGGAGGSDHAEVKDRLQRAGDADALGEWAVAAAGRGGADQEVADASESVGFPLSDG